jgi:hypothetical protein
MTRIVIVWLVMIATVTTERVSGQPANFTAQPLIAPARRIDWTATGAVSVAESRTQCGATVTAYTGTAATINSAIAACGTDQYVLLGAGTFTLSTGITFGGKNDVTLRGSGPTQTFLVFSGADSCTGLSANICVAPTSAAYEGSPSLVFNNWTAGYTKGTDSLTVSATTGLAVGRLAVLDQLSDGSTDTGDIWVCWVEDVCSLADSGAPASRTDRYQQQVVMVTNISGTTVTIAPALHMPNWRTGKSPQIWGIPNLISGVGIENLSMDHISSDGQQGVLFQNVYDSWVKNVRSLYGNRNHIKSLLSHRLTVRDSYFYGTQNAASQSYGVELAESSGILIENNIFQHITAPMVGGTHSGTVFAYNYGFDNYYNVVAWQMATLFGHSVGAFHTLAEGNDGVGITYDNEGASFFLTAFRNVLNGRDNVNKTLNTSPIIIMAYSRYLNFVGNVLGTSGYHTRYECAPTTTTTANCDSEGNVSIFNLGFSGGQGTKWSTLLNDLLTKTTLLRWGNYDTVSATSRWESSEVPTSGTYNTHVPSTNHLPASLYLSAKPTWFGSVAWPAIGPDVSGGAVSNVGGHAHKIPARVCYESTSATGGVLDFDGNACY